MELWAICAYEANAMLFSSQKTKSDEINCENSKLYMVIVPIGLVNPGLFYLWNQSLCVVMTD